MHLHDGLQAELRPVPPAGDVIASPPSLMDGDSHSAAATQPMLLIPWLGHDTVKQGGMLATTRRAFRTVRVSRPLSDVASHYLKLLFYARARERPQTAWMSHASTHVTVVLYRYVHCKCFTVHRNHGKIKHVGALEPRPRG